MPVYATRLRDLVKFTQFELSLVFAWADLGLTFGVTNGKIFARIGPMLSSVLALALLCCPYILLWACVDGHLDSSPAVIATCFFFAGQGSNLANCIGLTTNIRAWSLKSRPLAVGVLKAGFGVGVSIFAIIYHLDGAVPSFFLHVAIVTGAVTLFSALVMGIKQRPVPLRSVTAQNTSTSGASAAQSPLKKLDIYGGALLRSSRFWIAWVSYMLGQGASLLVVDQMGTIIMSLGGTCDHPYGADGSVHHLQFLMVVLFGLVNALGRFSMGPMTKRLETQRLFTVLLVCVSLVYLVLAAVVKSTAASIAAMLLVAFIFGGVNTVSALLTTSEFGDAHFSANYGYITFAPGIASVFYNLYPGHLYDAEASLQHCTVDGVAHCFGSTCFEHAFYIAAGGSIAAAALSAMLWRRPTTRSSSTSGQSPGTLHDPSSPFTDSTRQSTRQSQLLNSGCGQPLLNDSPAASQSVVREG